MSEKITVDVQITVDVKDVEALRRLASFTISPKDEQPYTYVPDGDMQHIAATYFGRVVSDAANGNYAVFGESHIRAR